MLSQFQNVFAQMAVLFAVMAAGYAAKKLHVMDDEFDRRLSKLVVNVSLPALILASVIDSESLPSTSEILQTICLSCGCDALLIALALLATAALRIPHGRRGVYRFMLTFGNTGFLGYPVVTSIFGSDALIYACIYNLPFNFLVFSVGVWFVASDNEAGVKVRMGPRDFVTPCVVCSVAAIAFAVLGVHDVPVAGEALSTLGGLTTPAALLIVGSSLGNLPLGQLWGGPRLLVVSLLRLVLMPVATWLVLGLCAQGQLLAMLVLLAGMPVATNGTMLCYTYGGDARTMAQGTFITTVGSIVTIPAMAALLMV